MKRKILLALALLLAATSLFAADFKFAIGNDMTSHFEFDSNGSSSNPYFFNLSTEFDMLFDGNSGMALELSPAMESGSFNFNLGLGYAYNARIADNVDMIFAVGPGFTFFTNGDVGFNAFATIDFDFLIGGATFIRVGTGVRVDFGEFGDRFADNIEVIIPLPSLAIGWRF